jgi:thiamine-phosphate pyrophosphorylase
MDRGGLGLDVPQLVVVADVDAAGGESPWRQVLDRLRGLRVSVPVAVQVRAKGRPVHALRELALQARRALGDTVPLVLNGPADLARELGFVGVHWPESEIPPEVPQEAAGLLRSASVHGVEALAAAEEVAHYAVFGPVFPPGSKAAAGVGVEALREVCRRARVPVLAVGGITRERVALCVQAGAAGVTVVSAVVRAPDPAQAAAVLAEALKTTPVHPPEGFSGTGSKGSR